MTKNRNLHSLCLVLNHPSTQPAPAVDAHATPAASPHVPGALQTYEDCFIGGGGYCQTSASPFLSSSDISYSAISKLAVISSESAILREGIITPVSPLFPAARKTAHESWHQHQHHQASNESNTTSRNDNIPADYFGYKKPSSRKVNSRARKNIQKVTHHDFTMPGSFPSAESPASMDDASYQRYVNDTAEVMCQIPAWIPSPLTGSLKIERYVSLSNLPTPPPTDSSACSPEPSPGVDLEDLCNPDLKGPAHYLSELIPKSASASAPSIPILRSMLHRANLRVEIIALAGIILDTLSSQFVRKWRTELSRYSLWEDGGRCEVLALCALGISMKFLDDKTFTTGYLSEHISSDRFCPQEINVTERLVLMDIDYALSSLSADAEICWAVREIQRCCKKVEGEEKEKEKNRMKAAETETDSKGEDHDRDESVCGDMGTDMQIDMDMEEYHTPWIGRFGDEELRW